MFCAGSGLRDPEVELAYVLETFAGSLHRVMNE